MNVHVDHIPRSVLTDLTTVSGSTSDSRIRSILPRNPPQMFIQIRISTEVGTIWKIEDMKKMIVLEISFSVSK